MSTVKLGKNCKLYVNTATSTPWATPTWLEAACVQEASLSVQGERADASSRASLVDLSVKPTLALELTAKCRVQETDDYKMLRDAAMGTGKIDVMILDGNRLNPGASGVRFWAQVYSKSQSQGRKDTLYDDFTLAPTPGDAASQIPQTVTTSGTAGSATATYTDIA